jgi:hypothetical protein
MFHVEDLPSSLVSSIARRVHEVSSIGGNHHGAGSLVPRELRNRARLVAGLSAIFRAKRLTASLRYSPKLSCRALDIPPGRASCISIRTRVGTAPDWKGRSPHALGRKLRGVGGCFPRVRAARRSCGPNGRFGHARVCVASSPTGSGQALGVLTRTRLRRCGQYLVARVIRPCHEA